MEESGGGARTSGRPVQPYFQVRTLRVSQPLQALNYQMGTVGPISKGLLGGSTEMSNSGKAGCL